MGRHSTELGATVRLEASYYSKYHHDAIPNMMQLHSLVQNPDGAFSSSEISAPVIQMILTLQLPWLGQMMSSGL